MFIYLFTPPEPISPSLISLRVSVDVKHHVYLLGVLTSTEKQDRTAVTLVRFLPRVLLTVTYAVRVLS